MRQFEGFLRDSHSYTSTNSTTTLLSPTTRATCIVYLLGYHPFGLMLLLLHQPHTLALGVYGRRKQRHRVVEHALLILLMHLRLPRHVVVARQTTLEADVVLLQVGLSLLHLPRREPTRFHGLVDVLVASAWREMMGPPEGQRALVFARLALGLHHQRREVEALVAHFDAGLVLDAVGLGLRRRVQVDERPRHCQRVS